MADKVIAQQRAQYGKKPVIAPYLLQTESEIPDYWNDERYTPQYTWEQASNPRYGNPAQWVKDGYAVKEGETALKTTDKELGKIEANWGKVPPQKAASFAQATIPDYWGDDRYQPLPIL